MRGTPFPAFSKVSGIIRLAAGISRQSLHVKELMCQILLNQGLRGSTKWSRVAVMSSTIIAGFKLWRKVRCHTVWLWKTVGKVRSRESSRVLTGIRALLIPVGRIQWKRGYKAAFLRLLRFSLSAKHVTPGGIGPGPQNSSALTTRAEAEARRASRVTSVACSFSVSAT